MWLKEIKNTSLITGWRIVIFSSRKPFLLTLKNQMKQKIYEKK